MLLEFKCSNHKSIKEEVKFSMIAGSDNTFEDFLKEFGNVKVLRSAIIYGANGSGKSNFISALSFMRDLVSNSINHQPGQGVFQARHKLSGEDIPSEYSVQFVRNDIRYAYGFSVKQNLIQDEYLYYFPKGRQVKIFERNGLEIVPGDRYKSVFDVSISILKENRLFLSCAANYSNVKEIEETFMFFNMDMVVYNPEINNWTEYSIELMQNNDTIRKVFVDILRALGTGVKDVKVKLEKVKISDLQKELQFPDALKSLLGAQDGNRIEAKVVYDQFEVDLMSEESAGVRRLFQMICPIIDILNKGKILICDELETSLHEAVIFQIVQLFQHYQKNKFAQLIFSTHDTSLLNVDLFRRDQVWFTQLNAERATDLYSLVEIRNVRKSENLEKGYVSGKYGAIPMLNKTFFQELEEGILG
ncbi:MAG: ATP-binding protein [Roseburia sp.]|nr:ATP-binding protein [Roseburia sp.]MCM1242934.1 ATP-binding protein [Roseburia sp.]